MTWSNYKRPNIVKFLIGITSQEVISVISKARGGGGRKVCDKHVTENIIKENCYQGKFFFS